MRARVLHLRMVDLLATFAALPTPPALRAAATLPNALTLAGYGLALWRLRGGPGWAALASVAADEAERPLARATRQPSLAGGALDYSTDVALSAMYARRLGAPDLAVAALTVGQSIARARGWTPPVSARTALVLADVAVDAHRRGARTALLTGRPHSPECP
jgi:hypothetical protein